MRGEIIRQLTELQKPEDWLIVRRPGKRWLRKRLTGGKRRSVTIKLHPDFLQKIARLGNAARMRTLEAKQRRRKAARKAAIARWSRTGHIPKL